LVGGQLVQRAEYRHGYGKLIKSGDEPAAFISQRFRLETQFHGKNYHVFGSIQDVRTWGSTTQTNLVDGFLSLHEGWVEVKVDTNWQIKLGRQELNYDNARFLGNLDWAMQGRVHDFALVKFSKLKHKLHVGGGFNQEGEKLISNDYKIANQYKTAQFIWYNYLNKNFELSFLFWNNGKQNIKADSLGAILNQDVRMSQTIGLPRLKYTMKNDFTVSSFAYYQFGKDVNNKDYKAYDLNLQISKLIRLNADKNSNFKFTVGVEWLSGTNTNNKENVNHSFSPMYGTNHLHNGYMDYFFVGGRFENSVGLNDLYLQGKYEKNKRWFLSIDIHNFHSNAKIYNGTEVLSNKLANELDLTGGLIINSDVSLQLGYSQLLSSESLKYLQASNASNSQNWAYIMLIIRPNSEKKFIGLLN
jgi:hypothetical protein